MSQNCPSGRHEMTPDNRYVDPLLHRVTCKACLHERNLARPYVSRARAPKAPLNPQVVAQLRAAAGIQTREDAR